MIITPRFRYHHLPKTGGTSCSSLLCGGGFGGRPAAWGHIPAAECPPEHRALTPVGTLRDPWSWHRSFFLHAANADADSASAVGWSDGQDPVEAFRAWIRRATKQEGPPPKHPGILWKQRDPEYDQILWEQSTGTYDWMIRRIYMDRKGQWAIRRLIATDHLLLGWSTVLDVRVEAMPHSNSTAHRQKLGYSSCVGPVDLDEWYDAHTLQLVDDATSQWRELFRYEYGEPTPWRVLTFDIR